MLLQRSSRDLRRSARFSALLAALAVALATASVRAQSDTLAAATIAFDQAEQLMASGNVADACSKYGESQRLDPQLGTLLHLADCLEQNGQTASAWAAFRQAQELAQKHGDARESIAVDHIKRLAPRLSKLQIDASANPDTSSLHVELDHVVVGSALWGAAIPTDPGTHMLSATSAGKRTWTGTVTVRADGSTSTVTIPALAALPSAAPKSPAGTAASSQVSSVGRDGTAPSSSQNPNGSFLARHWPAVTVVGFGLVGVGVGSVFGLQSKSKHDEAAKHCDGNACTDRTGVGLKSDAITAGNISTVAFIVGAVGLGAGTVLWLTESSRSEQTSRSVGVGVSLSGVRLQGAF